MLIEEIHEGSFGTHVNGHALAKKNTPSKLLLVDHGGRLLKPCQKVSQMSDLCRQDTCLAYSFECFDIAIAFLHVGHRCDRKD